MGRVRRNEFKKTPELLLLTLPATLPLHISPQGPGWKEARALHSRGDRLLSDSRVMVMMKRRRQEMADTETFILLSGGADAAESWPGMDS